MGDVYDALNRGRPRLSDDDTTPIVSPREETGGLPLGEVEDAARLRPGRPVNPQRPLNVTFSFTDPASPASGTHHRQHVHGACVPHVVAHTDRTGPAAEQYRQVRTQVLAAGKARKRQTHLLASAAPQEGKTVTCVNLGVVFAELPNTRTLLIEADLRRPTFQQLFNRPLVVGLVHALRGDLEDEAEAIHPTVLDNLHVMPAGEHDGEQAGTLLSSVAMVRLLDRLKDRYDHILLDSPPILSVADAAVLGALCDATLLVVRAHKTPRNLVVQARQQLQAAGATLAGTILTHAETDHAPRYVHTHDDA